MEGALPLRALGVLGAYLLVCREDFPADRAEAVARILTEHWRPEAAAARAAAADSLPRRPCRPRWPSGRSGREAAGRDGAPGSPGGVRVADARRDPLVAALILLAAAAAAAHPTQVAYARIAVEQRAVEIALSMNLFELDLVLTLDRDLDGTVSPAELEARRAEIGDYLGGKTAVTAAGRALPPSELRALGIGRSGDGRAVVEATLAFPAADPCAT